MSQRCGSKPPLTSIDEITNSDRDPRGRGSVRRAGFALVRATEPGPVAARLATMGMYHLSAVLLVRHERKLRWVDRNRTGYWIDLGA